MPRNHVAIVSHPMAEALTRGAKVVESRLYRHRRVPYGCVNPGDRVHFKVSGGSFIGTCKVVGVRCFSDLTPAAVAQLRRRYNDAVCAPASYWSAKRRSRYAVLIWLGPLSAPGRELYIPRQFGSAWTVLSGS